jgi:hypothetical protein
MYNTTARRARNAVDPADAATMVFVGVVGTGVWLGEGDEEGVGALVWSGTDVWSRVCVGGNSAGVARGGAGSMECGSGGGVFSGCCEVGIGVCGVVVGVLDSI